MIEKPKREEAPSNLAVLGRYVLTPEIFDFLENQAPGAGGEIQLTDSIKSLMISQAVYAYDLKVSVMMLVINLDLSKQRWNMHWRGKN